MKANELRIGNYVYIIDRSQEVHLPVQIPFKVVAIHIGGIQSLRPGEKLASIKIPYYTDWCNFTAIPLTEEWLIKFGFKSIVIKHDDKSESIVYKCYPCIIEDNRLYETETDDPFRFCRIVPSKINEYHFFTFVKYVHQLQNLYFSLTGEELKID